MPGSILVSRHVPAQKYDYMQRWIARKAMLLAIMGAAGRMGRELIRTVHETQGCEVAGAIERPGSPFLGKDAGEVAGVGHLGVPISAEALPSSLILKACSISPRPQQALSPPHFPHRRASST